MPGEEEGTHGPVSEEDIINLFLKHHGRRAVNTKGGYSVRVGRVPEWYTKGFQYFYSIHGGKILSVVGFSDWGTYNVLGGGFTYRPWKSDSEYFGNPIQKVMQARQPYLGNKPGIAGFSDSPGWQDRMIELGWEMEPMDNYGIDEEMVDNFRRHYGEQPKKTWGILTKDYNVDKMSKAYADFDSSWWNVIKVAGQESITDIPLDFESPDEKLQPKDRDCCEEAKEALRKLPYPLTWAKFNSLDSILERHCEELFLWLTYTVEDELDNREVYSNVEHFPLLSQTRGYADYQDYIQTTLWLFGDDVDYAGRDVVGQFKGAIEILQDWQRCRGDGHITSISDGAR
jgi:hypothetical protein